MLITVFVELEREITNKSSVEKFSRFAFHLGSWEFAVAVRVDGLANTRSENRGDCDKIREMRERTTLLESEVVGP
jgi:hypothetical protein